MLRMVTISQAAVIDLTQLTAMDTIYVTASLFTASGNLLEELGETVPILEIECLMLTQTMAASISLKVRF